jgi:hypothetical protein
MVSETQKRADVEIDAFVARVNRSPREPLCYDEVPEFLRAGEPVDAEGYWVPWAIRPAPLPCAWIDAFEAKLPGPLPRSYRSLVTRYQFPAFEVGPVRLFASTGGVVNDVWELVRAVFLDAHLSTPLLAAGFVQFGRVGWDPVCFDLNRRKNHGECPVLQLDHEADVVEKPVQVVAELADSFLALVASAPVG